MSRGAIALIGDPVGQSVSPPMHQAAFRAIGLDLDYVAVRVGPEALADAFPDLRSRYVGLNVTRPLKEVVIPLLDRIAPEAGRAGSVNTVVFGRESVGHSTDGAGFLNALRRAGATSIGRALVLGTGGAARAVSASLVDIGVEVVLWGRNQQAGHRVAEQLSVSFVPASAGDEALASALSAADLLVNATPIGGRVDECPIPSRVKLHGDLTVFDLVYIPRVTSLLRQAESYGCQVVEGVEMLVEQGALSFELWTGRTAPVDVMRLAAHRALDTASAEPATVAQGERA